MTSRPVPRPRVWVDLNIDENLAAGGSFNKDLLVLQTVDWQARTAVRHIGRLLVIPSVIANSTVAAQKISLGIGVVAAPAFTTTGAVPTPNVDSEFPTAGWVLRDNGILVNQQDSGTVEAWHFPEFRWDIRASRKVDRGVLFLRVFVADLLAGTVAVKVVGTVRTLVLI